MDKPQRTVSLVHNDTGAVLSKYLVCLHKAKGSLVEARALAAEHCKTAPTVEATFDRMLQRGAVGAIAISASDPYTPGSELLGLLQSQSIYGRISPKFVRVPMRTKTPIDLSGGNGSWKGEGLPSVLTKDNSGSITTEPYTASFTIVVTNELFRFGRDSERFLRDLLVKGLSRFIDTQMLDRTITATAGTRPASLTNGTANPSSAGSTGANVAADIATLLSNTTTSLDGAVLVCQTRTYLAAQAKLASIGYQVVPGYLAGIPVIAGSTSPRQLALIDCASIAFASDDQILIDVTREATVEMVDASSQSGLTGTGASQVSLFQSNLTAIRVELPLSYQHLRFNSGSPTVPSGVAAITVSY
jgi:hypothetical protein